jgi:uncharacterized RDD family membrane protein YckC/energy-coupling factor transporter ATP-binding protein EcfA2
MNTSSKLKDLTQPYPGLRPYLQNESELFFGRSEQINKMLGRLEERHFLAVVGGSGSGKSSLVRAGLLPVLKQGYLLDVGADWKFIVMKPGGDPFNNLATELYHTHKGEQDTYDSSEIAFIQAELQTSHLGLLEVIEEMGIERDKPLLLLVDQFEEIFRFQRGQGSLHLQGRDRASHKLRNDAAAFVNLLLTTVEQAAKMELPIYVMLTMRSDFIGACDFFPGLSQIISDSQFLVPRLTRNQMQVVIEKPIQLFGGQIEPGLVNQILNDTGTDPDQLPLMQHALMRTWFEAQIRCGDDNEGRVLNRIDYENVGRFRKALSQHLDEAWNQLDNDQQKIAKQLFLCLCEHAGEGSFIRRMVTLGELAAMADVTPDEVIDVVRVFQENERNFIVASSLGELNQKSVLDISHEALLRQWNRLATWIENEANSAQIYNRLVDTAILHKEKKAQLLVDPELQIALNWKASAVPNKVWAEQYNEHFELAIDFLNESKSARDHELAEEAFQHKWRIPRFFIFCFVFALFFSLKSDSGLIILAIWEQVSDIFHDLGLSDEFSYALSEVFLVGAHVALYLGLEYFLKGLYRRLSIEPIRRKVSNDSLISPDKNADETVYAGFWRRIFAGVIDVFFLYTVLIAVMVIPFIFGDSIGDSFIDAMEPFIVAILISAMWLYEAVMTSRWRQATFGKMVLSIYITDIKGEKLTFLRASARFLGKFILYGLGLLTQPFTEKRQALYDKVVRTVVVRK